MFMVDLSKAKLSFAVTGCASLVEVQDEIFLGGSWKSLHPKGSELGEDQKA